jgi:hypothetical protein
MLLSSVYCQFLKTLALTFSAVHMTYREEKICGIIVAIYRKYKYTHPSVYVLLAWYNYSYKIEEVEMGRTLRSPVEKEMNSLKQNTRCHIHRRERNMTFLLYIQQSIVFYRSYTKIYEVCYRRYSCRKFYYSNYNMEVSMCKIKSISIKVMIQ